MALSRAQISRRLYGAPRGRGFRFELLEDRRMLASVTVVNNLDVVNGDTSSVDALLATPGGDGISLREAILATNATPGADEIDFNGALDGATIQLDRAQLELRIQDDLTIDASGLADGLTIHAGHGANGAPGDGDGIRVLQVHDATPTVLDVTLRGLTFTGGDVSGDGGGIFASENLTLEGVTVTGNAAVGNRDGGGIVLDGAATLTLTNSTVSHNTAGDDAGGIEVDDPVGSVIISGSSIMGNTANGEGGGILRIDADPSASVESSGGRGRPQPDRRS